MHLDPLITSAPWGQSKAQALPSLFEDPTLRPQLGANGWTMPMINAQGLKIATYFWPATTEHTATIVVLHGHGVFASVCLAQFWAGKYLNTSNADFLYVLYFSQRRLAILVPSATWHGHARAEFLPLDFGGQILPMLLRRRLSF